MSEQEIRVPELGGAESVEIVGVLVSVGDSVEAEDPLLELESDKATVEMPAPAAGKITRLDVNEGDSLKEGDLVGMMDTAEGGASGDSEAEDKDEPVGASPARDEQQASDDASGETETSQDDAPSGGEQSIHVPELGGAESVEIVSVLVSVGDSVLRDGGHITREGTGVLMQVTANSTVAFNAIAEFQYTGISAGVHTTACKRLL